MSNTTRTAVAAIVAETRQPETEELATTVALDAVESCDERAAKLLVGRPCTVAIGSDSYKHTIAAVSASLHTITTDDGKVFRFSAKRGGYRARSYRLHIGFAIEHRDPSF